jgi:hypothetical protein
VAELLDDGAKAAENEGEHGFELEGAECQGGVRTVTLQKHLIWR